MSIGTSPFTASAADRGADTARNPKEPQLDDTDNMVKPPEEWTTGDDPMTGAQMSYLKTLTEQAHQPELFAEDLSKAEASKRIDELRAKLGLEEKG
jgi:hypothetical protein